MPGKRRSSSPSNSGQLVVLIGAARSGTKLVRDCLSAQSGIAVVPYDVNFIWRIGNEDVPHDELEAEQASPALTGRINRQLARWWHEPILVEKTVSNTLRVPFVNALFPGARFIHLIRNGYDVVESSYRQWMAPPDWRYLAAKLLAFPSSASSRYLLRFGRATIARQISRARTTSVPVWGPAYSGIEADIDEKGVLVTVARQWRNCVEKALSDSRIISADRWFDLRYEDFVTEPLVHLRELVAFCGGDPSEVALGDLDVRTSEKGKGKIRLSPRQFEMVEDEIGSLQRTLGYT